MNMRVQGFVRWSDEKGWLVCVLRDVFEPVPWVWIEDASLEIGLNMLPGTQPPRGRESRSVAAAIKAKAKKHCSL